MVTNFDYFAISALGSLTTVVIIMWYDGKRTVSEKLATVDTEKVAGILNTKTVEYNSQLDVIHALASTAYGALLMDNLDALKELYSVSKNPKYAIEINNAQLKYDDYNNQAGKIN